MQADTHSNTPVSDVHAKVPGKKSVFLSRVKRKILKHVWFVRTLLITGVFVFLYLIFLMVSVGIKRSGVEDYLGLARIVFSASDEDVQAINGRTNILILGKGGHGHEAPDLTDTIMVASVSFTKPQVVFVSLPRDIWIPELRTKLNSVYYWGNIKQPPVPGDSLGGGVLLAKSTVEKLLDEPIQYAVVVDFSGFKRTIEILGGIEVDVEHEFTDTRFPIPGRENDLCNGDREYLCRYETLSFAQGRQLMDGETALKFVRSRHAEGDEGTDLARSARQQKVVSAIKDKLLSPEVFLSQNKIQELFGVLEKNIETDIDIKAAAVLARNNLKSGQEFRSYVLPEEYLLNPPPSPRYDNLYVFVPKDESWSKVQEWINCLFAGNDNCN